MPRHLLRIFLVSALRTLVVSLGLAAGWGAVLGSAVARADGLGMPTQSSVDLASSDPLSYGPGWGDMVGGDAARPYVESLSVINGGVSTPVVTGGTTAAPAVPVGDVTTVVSPLNLCRAGQSPSPGVCYATPNRVAVTVGYGNGGNDGWDFSSPDVPVAPTIDSGSVIDMTVALNTLGKSLRWTWVNGELLYWQAHDLGQDDATVHIKFRPATAPYVLHFPDGNRCTASPPTNCEIPRADAEVLAGEVIFSLDDTLDPALTGSVFATQNAFVGFLTPAGSAQAPSLDVALSSTHLNADGTPELGTIEAFLPSAALLNLYGVLPSDSSTAFTTTRFGDVGTNDPPTYTTWTSAANGSDGVLITVNGITFSAPSYHISGRLRRVAVHARAQGARTTITATIPGCSRRHVCVATIYDLGSRRAPRFLARTTTALRNRIVATRMLSITAPASSLKRGHRYLLVVRTAKSHRLLVSTVATIN